MTDKSSPDAIFAITPAEDKCLRLALDFLKTNREIYTIPSSSGSVLDPRVSSNALLTNIANQKYLSCVDSLRTAERGRQ